MSTEGTRKVSNRYVKSLSRLQPDIDCDLSRYSVVREKTKDSLRL